MGSPVRVTVLTVSDGVARGERRDLSGELLTEWVGAQRHQLVAHVVVPDEVAGIVAALRDWCDTGRADVVITTGGTGFTERDVTPEATRRVIERDAPGIAEALRSDGARSTPYAWLSRGVAGIRGRTLIVNLPGSTGGVEDGLRTLAPLLPHAVQLLRGEETTLHG